MADSEHGDKAPQAPDPVTAELLKQMQGGQPDFEAPVKQMQAEVEKAVAKDPEALAKLREELKTDDGKATAAEVKGRIEEAAEHGPLNEKAQATLKLLTEEMDKAQSAPTRDMPIQFRDDKIADLAQAAVDKNNPNAEKAEQQLAAEVKAHPEAAKSALAKLDKLDDGIIVGDDGKIDRKMNTDDTIKHADAMQLINAEQKADLAAIMATMKEAGVKGGKDVEEHSAPSQGGQKQQSAAVGV